MEKDYASNSFKSKEIEAEEEKQQKVAPVVEGNVKVKKKSEVAKFGESFLGSDVRSVKERAGELALQGFKDILATVFHTSIDMFFGGGDREYSSRRSGGGRTSYEKYYRSGSSRKDDRYDYEERRRSRYSYDDIVFDTRADAERVLDGMFEHIDEFGMVSIGEMLDLSKLPTTYTDYNYGWYDIKSAKTERVRDGYIIRLPRTTYLD